MPTNPNTSCFPSVIIVGRNRVGKSTAAEYLSQRMDLPVVELGTLVRAAQAHDCTLSRDTNRAFCELRDRFGSELVVTWVLEAGISAKSPGIIVGVRDIDSFRGLSKSLPGSVVLAVSAPMALRLTRPQRGSITKAHLITTDRIHESWGLGSIIAAASLYVDNSSSLFDFFGQLNALLPDMGCRHLFD